MSYTGENRRAKPPWYLEPKLLIALLAAGETQGATAVWWAADQKHMVVDHERRIALVEEAVKTQLSEQNKSQNQLSQRLAVMETRSETMMMMLNSIDKRLENMNQRGMR